MGAPVAFTIVPGPAPELAVAAPIAPAPAAPAPATSAPILPQSSPAVATSSVSVTRRPKSAENKEARQVKRLSSSGEEPAHCTQSRSFRALEQLLFEGDNSAASDAPAEAPAPAAEVADTPL